MSDENQQLPESIRAALGQPVERTFTLERAALKVNEEERTVEIAFSSETPVLQWFGYEILDHSPKAADFRRLNLGGPVLLCHDRSQQVGGVVKKTARVDSDRVGRCVVRFSRSQLGTDTMQDVADEIRTTVSVRYIPHEMVLEKSDKNGDTYRVTKWEALEVSFEPIPADTSVGVGRTGDPGARAGHVEAFKRQAAKLGLKLIEDGGATAAPPPDLPAGAERADEQSTTEVRTDMAKENEEQPGVSAEVARAREVVEMGEVLGDVEMAREFAAEGKSVIEFRTALTAKRKAAQAQTPPEDPHTAAQRNGGGAAQVISRVAKLRSFKGDKAEERAYRFGQWAIAALLRRNSDSPVVQRATEFCRSHGLALQRAATEGVNEDGGFNVPTEFGNDLIDLREQYGVFRRNTRVVPMASDAKTQPRRTGGLTAYAVGETKAITESKKGWDQILLAAKKWGVLSKTSSELNEDSVVNWGDDIMGEIGYAFAQKEDDCGFNADGTSAYHGIRGVRTKLKGLSGTIANIAGLRVASGNTFDEFTLADFIAVMGLLPEYAESAEPKWFVHKTVWANTMVRLALAAGGVYAAEIERALSANQKMFLGRPVEIVQSMPSADANSQVSVLYGALRLASMLGDRRAVSIAMSDSDGDDFASDILSIRGITRFDINVHDVGNASGTPSARVPGPVVGLISAAS